MFGWTRLTVCALVLLFASCSAKEVPYAEAGHVGGSDGAIATTDGAETLDTDAFFGPTDGGAPTLGDNGANTPPSVIELSPATNGARLEALQIVAGGWSIWTERWRDTQLGIECQFSALADGSVRCLPLARFTTTALYYSSASCTGSPLLSIPASVVARWQACNTQPAARYVNINEGSCLPAALHGVLSRVDRMVVATTVTQPLQVYRRVEGSCIAQTVAQGSAFYRTTAVDMTSFVEAQLVTGAALASGRLAPVELVTVGGARERTAFFDSQRGERCHLVESREDELRCLPRDAAAQTSGNLFADAHCSTLAALGSSPSCAGTKYFEIIGNDETCRTTVRYFTTGTTVAQLYSNASGTCTSVSTTTVAQRVGAEIDATTFAGAPLAAAPGTTRLLPYRAVIGAAPEPFNGFYDTQLGLRCRFATARDGKPRCLPRQKKVVLDRFADAACSRPVVRFPCPTQSPYLLSSETAADGCSFHTRVFQRGAPLALGSTVYGRSSNGQCIAYSMAPGYHYYAVGAEVAPARFAEGVLR